MKVVEILRHSEVARVLSWPGATVLKPHGSTKRKWKMNKTSERPRLCWTRHDLVEATGLSYRTIQNLELRGLLVRVLVGVNVACYTDASVRSLFGANTPPQKAAP